MGGYLIQKVEVKIIGLGQLPDTQIEEKIGKNETVRSLLKRLSEKYGKLGKLGVYADKPDSRLTILLNNVNVWARNGLDTMCSNGDRIIIFPLIAGG